MLNKIKAKGQIYGSEFEFDVFIENNKISVTDSENDSNISKYLTEKLVDTIQEERRVIGGTYRPENNTLLAAYLALKDNFFDNKDFKLDVIGKLEEIPYEEGVIY